jgi:hypothetical protein
MPRKCRKQKGRGFLDFLKPVAGFLKDSKIISSVASLIPHPVGQTVGQVARAVGLGRKRKGRRRCMRGRGAIRV